MEVQILKSTVKGEKTLSYNLHEEQKQQFDEIHQQKINQAFKNLEWELGLMQEEARNGFRNLQSEQQIENIELRTKGAKNYMLEEAGFNRKEFNKYMNLVELRIEAIYYPFAKKTELFNEWLGFKKKKRQSNFKL